MLRRMAWRALLLMPLAGGLLGPEPVAAQVPVPLYTSVDSLPTEVGGVPIRSWSLFLVCEPGWILERDAERLWPLYWRFLELGQALGPEHAAVWFWTRDPGSPEDGEIHTAIDVVRSRAFCSRLELSPAEGPYLLVTTDYPGPALVSDMADTFRPLESHAVLRLPDPEGEAFEAVMEDVLEAVYAGDLRTLDRDTEGFWRAWEDVFQSVQGGLAGAATRIRVTIRTVFFEVTIG